MKLIALRRHNPFFQNNASSNRFLSLAKGLGNQGVSLKVILTDGYLSLSEKNEFNIAGIKDGIEYEYVNFITPKGIWSRRFKTYFLDFIYYRIIAKRILQTVLQYEGPIVWTTDDLRHQKISLGLKRKAGCKLFIELNEFLDIHKQQTVNLLQYRIAERSRRLFETVTISHLDGMALMTNALMKYFITMGNPPPRLLHLPMTVDMDRFQSKLNSSTNIAVDKPYIVYVGVLSNRKDGIDILLKAFHQISLEFSSISLQIFGPWHPDVNFHKQFIKENGLSDRVIIHGEVDRDEIPDILLNATALVLPRPDSHQARGGFPTKLGEYLASGVVVCATKVGEIPLYLEDGISAYLAEPGSSNSFAMALRQCLSDTGKAQEIGKNGREVARKYFNMNLQAKELSVFLRLL